MAIDQYAICPCGSGKKIKFCKCFDSIGELDRVTKMVQGGQMVAAIDRLNQVFKQHPSAAWALAIKGRLLIGMDELNTLSENADRFIQLQPSNPLALAQKAAAQAGQGKYSEAAYSVLQALAESGQSVDSFIIEICGMLAVGLYRQGIVLSSRMFATIALMASQDEQYQRLPRMVLEELNGSQDINLLLKTLPTTIPRPADVSWGERYDEAQSLLYSNQILASESKLEALDRQHPNEPAIMMSLFVCAIWRADPAAQARMLSKVSVALANDPEKAARLQAVAWLVESPMQSLEVEIATLIYDVDDAEKTVMELTSDSRLESLGTAPLQRVANEDGIHPKAAFVLLDRPKITKEEFAAENVAELPNVIGVVFLYGRQTDRAPQLMIEQVQPSEQALAIDILKSVIGMDAPTSTSVKAVALDALLSPRTYMPKDMPPLRNSEAMLDQLILRHFKERVFKSRLKCVAGKTLEDLTGESDSLRSRTAVMRAIQGNITMATFQPIMAQFCESIQVPVLPMLKPTTDDELEMLMTFDLQFVEIDSLNNDALFYYFERVTQVGLGAPALDSAKKIAGLEAADEETQEMIMRAYVMLISNEPDPMDGIKMADKARAWCKQREIPDASILLTVLPRYLQMQDVAGFSTLIQEIQTRYGKNPEVMTHLTRMLIDFGILNPDGTPRQMARPAAPAPSGLWTGDGPATAASGPAALEAGNASEGASKLWLPGMD